MITRNDSEPTPNPRAQKAILTLPGLLAFWDFAEKAGTPRRSQGGDRVYALREEGGTVDRVPGGPFSGWAARFYGDDDSHPQSRRLLLVPRPEIGRLNIHGPRASVSVLAWVRLEKIEGFVAGVWPEGVQRRQYGLFTNLPLYGGPKNVNGHISGLGGATPGYPWCRDYSSNATPIPENRWAFLAFTYDGRQIRSYLDGVFEARPHYTDPEGATFAKNPYDYPLGIFDAGTNGGDFTVGAVVYRVDGLRKHFLTGDVGGVAVFDRAMSAGEIAAVHQATIPR